MGWQSRGYLPHIDGPDLIQHVVFHLADSLPTEVVARLDREWHDSADARRDEIRRERIDDFLDAGHGRGILRYPTIAALMQDSLLCFHGDRYLLIAWVVMPNHVHALLQTRSSWTLGKIVGSWKSFTGRRINALLNADRGVSSSPTATDAAPEGGGQVWHREYFDRYVRDEQQLAATIHYIHENPVKAGLTGSAEQWPWSSASPENAERLKAGRRQPKQH